MKAVLLIGVAAGIVTIVGGVMGQQWMIGVGAVVLLVVIIHLRSSLDPLVDFRTGVFSRGAQRDTSADVPERGSR